MKNFVHLTLAAYSTWAPKIKNQEDLVAAWEGGADFKIYGGPYCSVRDLELMAKDLALEGLVLQHKAITTRIELS